MVPSTQCGERLRRTESYTNKVIGRQPNGKLDLDVGRIRQRQRDVGLSGSVYTPPGPHHFQTDHPGLGQCITRGMRGSVAVCTPRLDPTTSRPTTPG